jgi:hypothetical protein
MSLQRGRAAIRKSKASDDQTVKLLREADRQPVAEVAVR